MKAIGLISDTHLATPADPLPPCIDEIFSGVDAILHAGDIVHPSVVDRLSVIAPVTAVPGNMDYHPDIARLASRRILRFDGVAVGLIHGWGAPAGIQQRVYRAFEGENVQVIVHGHSHRPGIIQIAQCLIVNPGSPTDRRFSPCHSVGLLKIRDGRAEAEIIRIDGYQGR